MFTGEATHYMLNNFTRNSPPYRVTQDVPAPLQQLEVEKITGHESVRRDRVGVIWYETHCTGLSRPSWEWEMDLQLSPADFSLLGWRSAPRPPRYHLYRRV